MPLINKEIIKLIEDVRIGCGEISTRKVTDKYKMGASNDKLEVIGNPGPGSKAEIHWTMFEDDFDRGYIFTLPGYDSNDIWMTGIVHIPDPIGCEKQACDPEWIYLDRLLSLPTVARVKINEK